MIYTQHPAISENFFLHSSFTFPLFIGVTEWTNEGSVSFCPFICIVLNFGKLFIFAYLEGWFAVRLSSNRHLLYRCEFEISISFHAQCLQTCLHLQTRLLLMRYGWMSEGSKFSIYLHLHIFKELRYWQNQRVFWLSQLVRLLKWTVCFGKLKQFGLSKHTIHFDDFSSVISLLLLCSYSTTRL